jgi:hypothetical protein
MKTYDTPYKPLPDKGSLNKAANKTNPNAADYWGEIRINLKDMTAIEVEDGCHIVKLSGWKNVDKNGRTYLKLQVNRWVPENKSPDPKPQRHQDDDFSDQDIPF